MECGVQYRNYSKQEAEAWKEYHAEEDAIRAKLEPIYQKIDALVARKNELEKAMSERYPEAAHTRVEIRKLKKIKWFL